MPYFYDLPGFALMISRRDDDQWVLSVNGQPAGAYFSPQQAADDAATQHTGDSAYDASPIAAPEDLAEWSSR